MEVDTQEEEYIGGKKKFPYSSTISSVLVNSHFSWHFPLFLTFVINAWTMSGMIHKELLTLIASRDGNCMGFRRRLFTLQPFYFLNCISYACVTLLKIIKQTSHFPNTFISPVL